MILSTVDISLNKGAKLSTFKVTFDVMRHGEKELGDEKGALLTQRGLDQVESSVMSHMFGRRYDLAIVSDRVRTRQTVEHALRVMKQSDVEIVAPPQFAIGPLLDPESNPPCPPAELWEYLELARSTLDLIRQSAPSTFRMARRRLISGMEEICRRFADLNQGDCERRVLVGFHAPFAILATPNLADPPWVGEADVIRYRISGTPRGMVILSAEHLKCPLS
ncbi:MAG: hypothetical protein ABIA47_02325 [bacterium]